MRLRSTIAFGMLAATGLAVPPPDALAQATSRSVLEKRVQGEISPKTRAAEALINEAVAVSHAMEIYQDARDALTKVYIPVFRDALQGDLPSTPAPDAKTATVMAKALTVLDYTRRASDELDVALTEYFPAMVSDAGAILADMDTAGEINDAHRLLQLPAVRKGFDTLYAATKILTGLSYEDARVLSEFSAWSSALHFEMPQGLPGLPGRNTPVPPARRIAKTQALLNDILRVSRVDEITAEIIRFVRDVYLPTSAMQTDERQSLTAQVDQWEFMYNFQKSLMVAAAPSVLATALTDEQVAIIHTFVRSPAFGRLSDIFFNVIKSATSFTPDELQSAQKTIDQIDRKSEARKQSPEEMQKYTARWKAFAETWRERLKARISPDVLSGLEQSIRALKSAEEPL